ncbi:MAG: alpha/beta hydrolase [Hyphomicrobiales bacterium]|nr:alpha/beta hydrolase [Hyphomicrobiales bacterium]
MSKHRLLYLGGSAAAFSAFLFAAPLVTSYLTGSARAETAIAVNENLRVRYKTVKIDGLEVFYSEAGPKDAPALLLLHGFPSSSHMFRDLIPLLADKYRVVAPDYPGFGSTTQPPREQYKYTFENLYKTMDGFIKAVGLTKFAIYVQDYGGPIGFRIASRQPERVTAIIVQNSNAYDVGLAPIWNPIRAYWAEDTKERREALREFLKERTTVFQYSEGVPDKALINPDAWKHDQAGLDRPGNDEIQLDLFGDYRTNLALYPEFQKYFREKQPPTLVTWGKNDPIFTTEGGTAFKKDLPKAEVHLLDAGHFALETHHREIAALIRDFLGRNVK